MSKGVDDLLSVLEVSELIGCSKVHIWRLIDSDKLPAQRIGNAWAIARRDAMQIEVTTRARIHQAKKASKITKKRR
jgi:excisionase family DNA binding protein